MSSGGWAAGWDGFRGRSTAAQLKLPFVLGLELGAGRFPRSIDRGPIEASREEAQREYAALFPRSIDRGPIEALLGPGDRLPALEFPRSIDRGPIEAKSINREAHSAAGVSAVDRPRPN